MSKPAAARGGGRPATGSIVWADPATKTEPLGVRVTIATGRRKVVPFEPGTTPADAIALAPGVAERARHAVDGREGETVAEYAQRWCAWREGRGMRCVSEDRTRLAHALPRIGHLPIATIARGDLKDLVTLLDARAGQGFTVRGERRRPFSWKSAVCVWGTVRALFRDACGAKRADLCVREDNPAHGIAGPDRGASKAKPYLWPSEFLALVSCDRVPVRWRRLFALAVYTYARAGELAALEWGDVDLEHGTIHVHRSADKRRGRGVTTTKTSAARRVPIEPTLLPLLEAMRKESRGRGPVVRLPGDGAPSKLRLYLKRAGVTREDLFVSDGTRRALTFHDLRATGITWCAVRGDDPLKIMQRAGHADFDTTQIYLRDAENLAAGFGDVFPSLPADVLRRPRKGERYLPREVSASVSAFGVARLTNQPKTSQVRWPLRDSNASREWG